MERKKVYYTIEKSIKENKWILWRNTEGRYSCGCYRVFSGDTKKEVQDLLRVIKLIDNVTRKGVINI